MGARARLPFLLSCTSSQECECSGGRTHSSASYDKWISESVCRGRGLSVYDRKSIYLRFVLSAEAEI